MTYLQNLYEDTLTQFKLQIERSRALNDVARVDWLKEARRLIDREIADFSKVTGIE